MYRQKDTPRGLGAPLCGGRVVRVLVGRPRDVGPNRTEVGLERIVRRRILTTTALLIDS